MHTALKRLGWAAGVAAGAWLCFAMYSRRGMPTRLRSTPPLPSPHGGFPTRPRSIPDPLTEFPRNAIAVPRPSRSTQLAIEAASRPEYNDLSAVGLGTMDIQLPQSRGMRRTRMANWIVSLSLLAIALTCVYRSVASGKRPLARRGSDSMPSAIPKAPREDQRPWVGLLLNMSEPLTSMGGRFTIKLHNSGTSPAFAVRIRDIIRIEDISKDPEFPVIDTAPALAQGILMPGAELGTHVAFRTSPATIVALREGKVRAVNYLLVTYEDLSHRSHKTQQCFYWSPELQSPAACDKYNQAE